ncbi:MAG: preprotein translocase subunit SecA [Flavobacteriales bacterium]|jgi:preprotein translocase subunit SecA
MSIINTVISKMFGGSKADRDMNELQPYVSQVREIYPTLNTISDNDLRLKTQEFKQRIAAAVATETAEIETLKAKSNEASTEVDEKELIYSQIDSLETLIYEKTEVCLGEILPEAFAVIKETAKRLTENKQLKVTATEIDFEMAETKPHVTIDGDDAIWDYKWDAAGNAVIWNMIHYDVQLIGGAVLHQGKIAEMQTGEGKTLVATLPVYLNALTGKGVHVVTVNDYLAKRDAEWNAPLFQFHGLRVDCIDNHQPNSDERRKAYLSDITYGTNNEFGFDYLRDNMARNPIELVQRKHNYAIVDEVDSVLVDDARTPLIISGPVPQGDKHEFNDLKPRVDKLVGEQRKLLTGVLAEAKKKIAAGEDKDGGLLLLRVFRGLPRNKALIKFLSEQGVKALLQKTENHYMQDNSREMHKVDAELYFVIDEKQNSIELTDLGIELITGSGEDPDFYIMPDVSIALNAIETSEDQTKVKAAQKEQLMRDFSIKSERIHTMNQLLKAYTLFEKDTEYVVMDNKVKIVDEQTGRIMDGRRYSDGLHQAIEAKENVKIEAASQTMASITLQNYFRMYKKLAGMTGTAETEAGELWDIYKLDVVAIPTNRPITRKDEQDFVFKTNREKYNAVIEEVARLTEAGRPVLVGTTSVDISELLSRTLKIRNIKHNVLNAKLHQREAEIVAEAGNAGTVTIATNMAGRGTDIKLSDEVKAAGGLAIVGTERHDSRRVDRQLRGRSGRQGDPGSSQFFVSLEDNLMRLFGSDRIAKLMDRMGIEEGEVIQHSMVSKSIERAQKKVEENNFGIRKRLLEYDDVMNAQREVIYKRRHHALFGDRLSVDISNMVYDTLETLVTGFHDTKDYNGLKLDLFRIFAVDTQITEAHFNGEKLEVILPELYQEIMGAYQGKMDNIARAAYPVIKDVFENQGATYENIVVPFTDGIKSMQVVTNLKKAYESEGLDLTRSFEKNITLAIIDQAWKEHLREMDSLKQSVQGAVYEQKDPLLIYKFESFELFKTMINDINKDIVSFLFKANLPAPDQSQVKEAGAPQKQERLQTSRPGAEPARANNPAQQAQRQAPPKQMPVHAEVRIGRNDKVEIINPQTLERKSMKFKQAEPLLQTGQWKILNPQNS